jgi:hypothetical protein
MIPVRCPHCRARYSLPDRMAGASFRCDDCGRKIHVPGDEEGEEETGSRRRILLLCVGLPLFLILLGGLLIADFASTPKKEAPRSSETDSRPRPRLTRDSFLQVRIGMTQADVELLLGRPESIKAGEGLNSNVSWNYRGSGGTATIIFNANGVVIAKDQSGL